MAFQLTGATVAPATAVRGAKLAATIAGTNPDRVGTFTVLDENGVRVSGTFDLHTNLPGVLLGQANVLPNGRAPAGTLVAYTDSPTDVLTVDAANPLQVDIQT